ncbi:PREDICTED: uncharacterized protein LOC109179360 isoform X3 [Ipomoea nil]|uniref:uncharacterized protein LOC109179360 isoform X3 n=1 Tax=Ipomoea nil TaxID=35883 RepID=UPI000901073F|nr:PREDICTED: uncharacterized protein LOC109179360 isoform X3 [Ipomoea nil]
MAKDDDQDFSFPATVETPPPPRFLEPPPIWWRTSAASHRESPKKEEDDDVDLDSFCYFSSLSKEATIHAQRRSFSCIEGRTKRRDEEEEEDDDDGEEEEEEKMDMLWEDFNEEYKRSRELKFVQSLKLTKAVKRPRMVVVMKVLKKVFLLHHSHHSIFKKHP